MKSNFNEAKVEVVVVVESKALVAVAAVAAIAAVSHIVAAL